MTKTTLAALLVMAMLLAACGDTDETGTVAVDANDSAETSDVAADTDSTASTASTASTDSTGDGAVNDPEPTPAGFSLNGFRYCEILMTVPGDDGPVTEVWGTPGVDTCEDEDWNAIDPEELKADFDATWILMNGPRYFTVDGSVDTAPAATGASGESEEEIREFGSVPMRLLATVDETYERDAPYSPGLVVRTTTWTVKGGTEVYELTDPDGNTYVMQSYALIEDPDLTADDLATLGERLDLPEGWTYSSRMLDADLQVALTPEGAIVVQDEFQNSYQRN